MSTVELNTTRAIPGRADDRLRPVRIWLYAIAGLVLLMVAIGGITRLTGSGLSITEWKPISGAIPPLTDADWQAEFEAYQRIPQFQLENHWMSVDEFKSIFWWEWIHRFLGRIIGLAFAVPFVVFLVQKRLTRDLALPLFVLFVLGGFQGALGWWMVSSGLTELTSVSQYRLAAHFGAAAVLFGALIWVARSIEPQGRGVLASPGWRRSVIGLGGLIFLQLIAGAFVAGLDAGYAHNTWPTMDGEWIPAAIGQLQPWWLNMFENITTVQFQHRMIAYAIVIYAAFWVWRGMRAPGFKGVHGWVPLIGAMVAAQVLLGIATLLLVVPIALGVAHQVLAFLLVGAIVAYLADMRRSIR